MKVFDTVNNVELEADTKKLVDIMVDGRQVDVYLKEKKSDEDGYKKRFIRCYSLEGRVLSESTGHNIYDLYNEFKPEDALKVELS